MHVDACNTIDPLMMEGRVIMFNHTTPFHADLLDPPLGWAFLVILGNFMDGTLWIPWLCLQMTYNLGDIVAIRGHVLGHEVELWQGEQCICLVHFTHQALWDFFGVECP